MKCSEVAKLASAQVGNKGAVHGAGMQIEPFGEFFLHIGAGEQGLRTGCLSSALSPQRYGFISP